MLLLIDKPKGITSHDVVYKVRKITGEKRVGHGGTLDPNATGLLIVGVGREDTKKLGFITKGMDKTYEAEIFLGEERSTDDIEGEVINSNADIVPDIGEINLVIKKFIGKQLQAPPAYSAIKLQGKKAYDLARKGHVVKIEPREIIVHSIKLLEYNFPILKIEFAVSSGTYIRALSRDIGRELKTYGYLRQLRRTKIGEYDIKNALDLDELAKQVNNSGKKEN